MKKIIFIFFLLYTHILAAQTMGEWTWMKGPNTPNSSGVFGTKGVPDPANYPPALYEACSWTDTAGNFWLFGGALGMYGYNTLWKYTTANNIWTWMNGSCFGNDAGNYGIKGIPSATNCPSSRGFGIMTWVDKTNNLWLYGGIYLSALVEDLWKYDISNNEWTWMSGSNSSTFITNYGTKGIPSTNNCPPPVQENNCTWVDNTNNLWFYGGMGAGGPFMDFYYNDLWKYNTSSNEWTWIFGNATSNYPAIYGQKGVASPTNNPGGRACYASFTDGLGNFYLFGSGTNFFNGFAAGGLLNDIWKFDITTNNWSWISGDITLNSNGFYGAACTADSLQTPLSRFEVRASWTDSCGFWIYGGWKTATPSVLSDFWRYDFITNTWTRISGSTMLNEPIISGSCQVSSPTNNPGGRGGNVSWMDKQGNLWMFGGFGTNNYLADLWRFVPDTNCVKLCIPKYKPPIPPDTTKPEILIPNFLTPNGDGINDVFAITVKNYTAYRLMVFNRWGNPVFESRDANLLWNGREQNNGKECADGIYFYILYLTDNKQIATQHKGSVTIMR